MASQTTYTPNAPVEEKDVLFASSLKELTRHSAAAIEATEQQIKDEMRAQLADINTIPISRRDAYAQQKYPAVPPNGVWTQGAGKDMKIWMGGAYRSLLEHAVMVRMMNSGKKPGELLK